MSRFGRPAHRTPRVLMDWNPLLPLLLQFPMVSDVRKQQNQANDQQMEQYQMKNGLLLYICSIKKRGSWIADSSSRRSNIA